jgi:hypothetical protein
MLDDVRAIREQIRQRVVHLIDREQWSRDASRHEVQPGEL